MSGAATIARFNHVSSRPPMTRGENARVHERSIVVDLVCPLANSEPHLDEWIRGGVTAVGPTVASDDDLPSAMVKLATWHARLRRLGDRLLHVTTVADFERAKQARKLGIVFHFQNTQ